MPKEIISCYNQFDKLGGNKLHFFKNFGAPCTVFPNLTSCRKFCALITQAQAASYGKLNFASKTKASLRKLPSPLGMRQLHL